jgi:hypothetical protein
MDEELLGILKARFDQNPSRHPGINWSQVRPRLENNPSKLWSVGEMNRTGGEPDIINYDPKTGEYIFADCSPETPRDRRSLCYDRPAWAGRKVARPAGNAIDTATAMGITILTESEYRYLQTLGKFDLKTSSWLLTPANIRQLGGAIFADRRYDTVFIYHNGADSYYAARGFRGILRV